MERGKVNGEQPYSQPQLEGLTAPEITETLLENCLILVNPTYKDTGKRREWECFLHAQPTLFEPDLNMEVLAFATNKQATEANRKSLKAGDRAMITGRLDTQTLTLQNGQTQTITRLAVTHIEVTSREK